MKVSVHYLAQLRSAAGVGHEAIELNGDPSLSHLVRRLGDKHGEAFRRILQDEQGGLRSAILFFVGEEQALASQPLRDGDVVTSALWHAPAFRAVPLARKQETMPLSDLERAVYEWQMWVPDFGEAGQERLKAARVLVSRVGGVGGSVAYQLAAAGVGKLVLAHAGNLRESDLNRQLLMTHDWLGKPRVDSAARRLQEMNPRLEVVAVPDAARLVEQVDVVASCAPLFRERLAMNHAAVRQGKPLVDCAMYELELQLTTVLPGQSPCLACLYPEEPPAWKRQFPVFGAVSGVVGSLGAMEVIKVIAGLGEPLAGKLLIGDLRTMAFRRVGIQRNPQCAACG
jgi:molybdopterin/thiamine biosynthesis adenylyltransferase/molybdopterin converting factor small subunit